MIRTVGKGSGNGLMGDMPGGAVAYVDAEWLSPEPGVSVPAIVVDREQGTTTFGGEPSVPLGAVDDPDVCAARILLQLCEAAVAALDETQSGDVEVWGRGAVAGLTAELLGVKPLLPGSRPTRPTAIIDTTGDADALGEATRRLADLGTLVLVGEPGDRQPSLDLYTDVHSRGLRIVGVPRPARAPADLADRQPERIDHLLASLRKAPLGSALEAGAEWYGVA